MPFKISLVACRTTDKSDQIEKVPFGSRSVIRNCCAGGSALVVVTIQLDYLRHDENPGLPEPPTNGRRG
eukprot:scaffold5564_cov61-Attheya_sp.AAC.4